MNMIITISKDYKKRIDNWLENKSHETIKKIQRIIKILKLEGELEEKLTFKIPHGQFKKNQLRTYDVIRILEKLQWLGCIEIYFWFKSNDYIQSVALNLSVFREKKTKIKIKPEKFEYLEKKLRGSINSKKVSIKKFPLKNWDLSENEDKAFIKQNGKTVFEFPNISSNKYHYFQYLWNNFDKKVSYPKLYESVAGYNYPHKKGKNWKVNDGVRNTINKLKKEIPTKKLSFEIIINKGVTLRLKNKNRP